jgi:branched-chain amino acid transport system ATP-binding protein
MLEVRALDVRAGDHQLLRGIDLAVPERSVVAVLGANGAGKTTLMRTISGIYRRSAGAMRFRGEDVGMLPSHAIVRRGIAQVPEGRQVFGGMTVRENLLLGAVGEPPRIAGRRLPQLLDRFPVLRDRQQRLAGSLSGGEQQMLAIARALMSGPRLLLLDEPSLGLAPKVVDQVFALLEELRRGGLSILLVEQNAGRALAAADHAFVLERGQVVLQGPAAALREDPRVRAAYLGAP